MSNQENVFETILAPMTGTAVAITEVPDPIFIREDSWRWSRNRSDRR